MRGRAASSPPKRTSVPRLVYVGLVTLLLAPVPPLADMAEANPAGIDTSTYQTDNLIRWGLAPRGLPSLVVSSDVDNTAIDPFADCTKNAFGHVVWTTVITLSPCAAADRDDVTKVRLRALGGVGVDAPVSSTGEDAARIIHINQTINTTMGAVPYKVLNFTWPVDVPVTDVYLRGQTESALGGGGTWYINASLIDDGGTVVRRVNLITSTCGNSGATYTGSATFDRTVARSVLFELNKDGCAITGTCAGRTATSSNCFIMKLSIFGGGPSVRIWSKGNIQDANTFNSPELALGDWMTARGDVTSGGSSTNVNLTADLLTVPVPPGRNVLYHPVGCSSTSAGICSPSGFIWISPFSTDNGGLGIDDGSPCITSKRFMGISRPDAGSEGGSVAMFEVVNGCSQTLSLRIRGKYNRDMDINWMQTHAVYFNQGGGTLGSGSVPITVTCACTGNGPTTKTAVMLFKDRQGPEGTVPQSIATDSNWMKLNTATYTATGMYTARTWDINVTLDRASYFGNAIYWTFAVFHSSLTNTLCNNLNLTVNGVAGVPVSWKKNVEHGSLGSGVVCSYLIEDHVRTSGSDLVNGQNPGIDVTRVPKVYNIKTEAFSSAVQSLNLTLYTPIAFPSGSLYTQCSFMSSAEGGLCYGNINTAGVVLGAVNAISQWNFHVLDVTNSSNHLNLPDVLILDRTTAEVNTTDAGGLATLRLATLRPNFTAEKFGYNTWNQSFVNPIYGTYNVVVKLTRDSTQPFFDFTCESVNTTTANCTATPTNDSGQDCAVYDANALQCSVGGSSGGGVKRVIFLCPREVFTPFASLSQGSMLVNGVTTLSYAAGEDCPSVTSNQTKQTTVSSSGLTLAVARNGYRSLTAGFTATQSLVVIQAFMSPGNGTAVAGITYSNGTQLDPHDGIVKTSTIVTLYDQDPGGSSGIPGDILPPGSTVGQPINIEAQGFLTQIGCVPQHDSGIICGFVIMLAPVVAMAIAAWDRRRDVGAMALGLAAFVGFGIGVVLRLWPIWMLAIGVLIAIGLGVYTARQRLGGSTAPVGDEPK